MPLSLPVFLPLPSVPFPLQDPPPTNDDDGEMATSVPLSGAEHLKENGSETWAVGKKLSCRQEEEEICVFPSSSDEVHVDGEVVFSVDIASLPSPIANNPPLPPLIEEPPSAQRHNDVSAFSQRRQGQPLTGIACETTSSLP